MSDLPAPLVPADADVATAPYMPLIVAKLRRSRSWLKAKRRPELGFYMLNLWIASWSEKPAGSLEDDDAVLCEAAMCSPKKWPKVRADVVAGFIKCSDQRLYHPVVCEQVEVVLSNREGWRKRQKKKRSTEKTEVQGLGGAVTRDSRQSHALSDSDNEIDNDSDSRAQAVVADFLSLRKEHWPNNPNFPSGHGSLLIQAKEYLAAGATIDLCREVMARGMAQKKANGEPTPPTNLRLFKNSIPDAIARASRPRPVADPRPPRPNRPATGDVQALLDRQMAQFNQPGDAA